MPNLYLFTDVEMKFLQAAKMLFRYVFVELPGAQRDSLSNGRETLRRFKVFILQFITIFCSAIIDLNAHSYIK